MPPSEPWRAPQGLEGMKAPSEEGMELIGLIGLIEAPGRPPLEMPGMGLPPREMPGMGLPPLGIPGIPLDGRPLDGRPLPPMNGRGLTGLPGMPPTEEGMGLTGLPALPGSPDEPTAGMRYGRRLCRDGSGANRKRRKQITYEGIGRLYGRTS